MRLKICDSHLTCKIANKCLNVPERVEVVEWNKRWFSPIPCCPVSCQCPWNKTLNEKKYLKEVKQLVENVFRRWKYALKWNKCFNFPWNFLLIRTCFGNIIRKMKTDLSRPYSRTCFYCHCGILQSNDHLLNC